MVTGAEAVVDVLVGFFDRLVPVARGKSSRLVRAAGKKKEWTNDDQQRENGDVLDHGSVLNDL